jgi:hypothetical protein
MQHLDDTPESTGTWRRGEDSGSRRTVNPFPFGQLVQIQPPPPTRMGLRCTVLAGDEPILGLGFMLVSEQSGTGATKVACKAYGLDLQVNPIDE